MYSLKDALYKAFRPHGLIHDFQTSNPQQKFKSRQILIGREISSALALLSDWSFVVYD